MRAEDFPAEDFSATRDFLTTKEASALLGVMQVWVQRLIQSGRLPAVKHASPRGDYWLIAASDLEAVRGLKRTGRPPKTKPDPLP